MIPNQFQSSILKSYPQITLDDFSSFARNSEHKIMALGLPKADCIINTIYVNANDAVYHRREYCLHNCGFECLHNR